MSHLYTSDRFHTPERHSRGASRGGITRLAAVGALASLALSVAPPDEPVLTQRASTSSAGTQPNGASSHPCLSGDGRFVAFASSASNLVPGDGNGHGDVFVKDMTSGSMICASITPLGVPASGESCAVSLGGNGQRIAFASDAADLVGGDTNRQPDVFVRDLATQTTWRASVSASGAEADSGSAAPRLSADGRFLAFASRASNLVAGDTNGFSDVFVRDLAAGTLERASLGAGGANGDGPSEGAAISADGRFVAFASTAANLIAGEGIVLPRRWQVYVRDRVAGTTVRASVSTAGDPGNGHSFSAALSGDGRWIAFTSGARNLVGSDLNSCADVFVRDLATGTTLRATTGPGNQETAGASERPALSADGRWLTFESGAANVVPEPAPPKSTWVCVRDLSTGITTRVVAASAISRPDGGTQIAAISADGRWIAFSSAEPDLVAGDTNELEDLFVRGPMH